MSVVPGGLRSLRPCERTPQDSRCEDLEDTDQNLVYEHDIHLSGEVSMDTKFLNEGDGTSRRSQVGRNSSGKGPRG